MLSAESATKLFIGQIPPSATEDDLRKYAEPYGEIVECVILRNRATGVSKGSGFITFSSSDAAEKAIAALDGKVSLDDSNRTLAVRLAHNKESLPAKLFVGMLSNRSTEEDVQKLFSQYGEVMEVYIIKDNLGSSKGCAFVKYKTRAEANEAIASLNGIHQDEGAPRNLVVKYADNKPNNNRNRMPNYGMGGYNYPNMNFGMMPGYGMQQYGFQPPQYGTPNHFNNPVPSKPAASSYNQVVPNAYSSEQSPYQAPQGQPAIHSPYNSQPNPNIQSSMYQQQQVPQGGGYGGSSDESTRGPQGANLFVLNIPETFSGHDFVSLFTNFGPVLSSKLFSDKSYGFISYATPESAEKAIQALHGFHIGGKRMKVMHKTSSTQSSARGYSPY